MLWQDKNGRPSRPTSVRRSASKLRKKRKRQQRRKQRSKNQRLNLLVCSPTCGVQLVEETMKRKKTNPSLHQRILSLQYLQKHNLKRNLKQNKSLFHLNLKLKLLLKRRRCPCLWCQHHPLLEMVKRHLPHPRVLLESQDLPRKFGSQDSKYPRNLNLLFNRHHQEDRVFLSHQEEANHDVGIKVPFPSHHILEEETVRVPKDHPARNYQHLLICQSQLHPLKRQVLPNLYLQNQCLSLNSLRPSGQRWKRTQPLKSSNSQRKS